MWKIYHESPCVFGHATDRGGEGSTTEAAKTRGGEDPRRKS